MAVHTTRFEKPGPQNTDKALRLAVESADRLGIKNMAIASRTGKTAMKLVRLPEAAGIKVVVVAPQFGWHDKHEFDFSLLPELRAEGHDFHTGSMPFHMKAFHGGSHAEAMADALRIFGQGTQVCVEIALMAVDGGHMEAGKECVLIAGTRSGADTAITAAPSSSMRFKEFSVRDFICRPY